MRGGCKHLSKHLLREEGHSSQGQDLDNGTLSRHQYSCHYKINFNNTRLLRLLLKKGENVVFLFKLTKMTLFL